MSNSETTSPPNEPIVVPWLAALFRPIYRVFIPTFFRLSIKGAEHIPRSGPVLLVPTHRSRWDPILLASLTKRPMCFLASHDEFVGIQGFFMKRFGAFPVNTKRPSPSTLRTCASVLLKGQILVIFAEGTIFYYPPDQVHPLRPGAAWLALKVQQSLPDGKLAIVAVRIRYGKLKPKFRDSAELEAYPPIDVSSFLDRPEKRAIIDLTAEIQARMGDVVNPSTKEMATARDQPSEGSRKKRYGRSVP
jgi:1-acyl-sn-glycerol-3-phosphate acyltransferase